VIAIRLATADDRAFIDSMVVEAVNWNPAHPPLSPEAIAADPVFARYVAGWPRPSDIGVVAEVDGSPVGAAWLRFFDGTDPGYGFIADTIPELSIGVVAGWRGRGVGGLLIEDLATIARARGIASISLSVEAANPARRLYERIGFRTVVAEGDALTMRLDLGRSISSHR
jgi:GNAT superfamily N-acetyltransferase